MKNTLRFTTVLILISLLIRASLAAEYTVEPWSSGILANEPAAASALIRSGGELDEAKEALGITGPLPGADFGKHALLLIIPVEGTGGIIEIAGVTPAAGGALEVRYRVRSEGPRPEGPVKASYPYLILKLSPAPGADLPVRLIDEDYVNTLSSGTGLGQFREYTNVLSAPEDAAIAEYLPIDKGNTWTYKSETSRGSSEVTNSVVSESDGWSVFDTFFGVPGVGMKISPGGDMLGLVKRRDKDVLQHGRRDRISEGALQHACRGLRRSDGRDRARGRGFLVQGRIREGRRPRVARAEIRKGASVLYADRRARGRGRLSARTR